MKPRRAAQVFEFAYTREYPILVDQQFLLDLELDCSASAF